jgi:hypothetical protein
MSDVAVLIHGKMRTLDICAPSILETFPGADFYVYAINDKNAYKAELLDPVRFWIEPEIDIPERAEYTWQVGLKCMSVQKALRMFYSSMRVWQMFKTANKQYKWVVKHRADLLTVNFPKDTSTWKEDVMVPGHDNYRGLNDWHAILTPKAAEKYFLALNYLDEYIDQGGVFQPESFLKWRMKDFTVHQSSAHFNILKDVPSKFGPNTLCQATFNEEYGDKFIPS